jgi:acyl carrier protein
LHPESRLQDTLCIDSIDVLDILAASEQRYGVYFTDQQMVELRCYGDLLALLGIEVEEPVS